MKCEICGRTAKDVEPRQYVDEIRNECRNWVQCWDRKNEQDKRNERKSR